MYSIGNSMAVVRILFLFISIVHCNASEPYCRQFEYDEKMLSKMIRTELELETLKKELLILENAFDKKIESAIKKNNDNNDGNLQALSIGKMFYFLIFKYFRKLRNCSYIYLYNQKRFLQLFISFILLWSVNMK